MFEVSELSLQFGPSKVLDRLSFALPEGSLTWVLGPNGSGKSSLLRCLAGLQTGQAGTIVCKGRPLGSYSREQRARLIAWVPSSVQLGFDMRVEDLVLLGRFPWHRGYPRAADKKLVAASLAAVGISALASRLMSTLSSGEAQKAQLARALAAEVDCLILDEPCAHLDAGGSFDFLSHLQSLSQAGKTVILSSHDLFLSPRFAETFLLLRCGRLLRCSSEAPRPAELSTLFGLPTGALQPFR